MKTLVIHPYDETTNDLCLVYKDHPEWSIIRYFPGQKVLHKLIQAHDRIIILSHGDETGMGDLKTQTYWLDCNSVQWLKGKEVVGIWCYASDFFEKYKLKGFATGMFISEIDEAYLNCVTCTEKDIRKSNRLFSFLLKDYYNKYDSIIEYYNSDVASNSVLNKTINPVIEFNKTLLKIFY